MDVAKVQSKLAQVEAQARQQEDRVQPLGFDRHWNRFWALGGTPEGHPGTATCCAMDVLRQAACDGQKHCSCGDFWQVMWACC